MYKKIDVSLEDLKPYAKNSRTHNSEQIRQIMDSIREFGFTNPLLVNENMEIIAGHGRLEAVKQLNRTSEKPIEKLPCMVIEGLSEAQHKALVIADNRIALNAGWDYDTLQSELEDLDSMGFDMDLLGFDTKELDNILAGLGGLEIDSDLEEIEASASSGGGELDSTYTHKIVTPIYEIKGDKPSLSECVDSSKVESLIQKIEASKVSEAEKDFLRKTAYRFMDYHFANIAELYAHSGREMQELMEELALVIIDYDKAIELGYVKLCERIEGLVKHEE